MSGKKRNSFLSKILSDKKSIPFIAGVSAGLYPLLFYYTNNYRMINSWKHFVFFIGIYIFFPIAVILVIDRLSILKKIKSFLLPFLNIFFFIFFLSVALYAGFNFKRTLIICLIAFALTFIIRKFFKKWLGIQLILAVVGFVFLIPVVINQLNYSDAWKKQPDDIEQAIFKKKPNIYFIQPDGYLNFSELKKGKYQIDNSEFETYLRNNNFKDYPGFRSNYAATLPSNSAIFMMKHHYYNEGSSFTEIIDARKAIVSENSFLKILKNNAYQTFLLTEQPYFLTNKPKLGYDYSNFSTQEINYITTGIGEPRNIFPELQSSMKNLEDNPGFFFIQIFRPGHISTKSKDSKGVEGEKEKYVNRLQESNEKLKKILDYILEHDSQALIVMVADHGGFVGFHHTEETETKTQDRDLLHSVFSTILAIHWPNKDIPEYDSKIKSSVNLLRILTAYLSEKAEYLENLQDDGSYLVIKNGAPKGVYQVLNNEGNVIFKKYELE